jgi:hypothetical protein
MSAGELIPEHIRDGLDEALAQLPWDIYADLGNVYLAVLLQGTGWVLPRNLTVNHELTEQQVRREMDEPEPAPQSEPPLDLRFA